jgi:hypothetical protein
MCLVLLRQGYGGQLSLLQSNYLKISISKPLKKLALLRSYELRRAGLPYEALPCPPKLYAKEERSMG